MSDTKKYNSIVFLTTLSVYLGLVLVGGANSPVLAQAALTRNFDVQEEIEYKDDLDKKPDEKSDKALDNKPSLNLYSDVLAQLIEKTSLPAYQVSIDFNCDFCRQKFGNGISSKETRYAPGNLEINPGKSSFFSKLNIKPRTSSLDSNGLVSQLNAKLFSLRSESKNASEKLILDDTFVSTENNQIFVVTRLPRASIDSLLADKNAI